MNKVQRENYTRTLLAFLGDSGKTQVEISNILSQLHRYEVTLSRYNEIQCMRDMTPYEVKREESTMNRVKIIAEFLGFGVYFNGDPRGYAIRFLLPSKRSNNWDGESWCLNW